MGHCSQLNHIQCVNFTVAQLVLLAMLTGLPKSVLSIQEAWTSGSRSDFGLKLNKVSIEFSIVC